MNEKKSKKVKRGRKRERWQQLANVSGLPQKSRLRSRLLVRDASSGAADAQGQSAKRLLIQEQCILTLEVLIALSRSKNGAIASRFNESMSSPG